MDLQPLKGKVLVKELKQEETESGILLPENNGNTKEGEVISLHPEEDELLVGDKVLFQSSQQIKYKNEEYELLTKDQILTLIKNV